MNKSEKLQLDSGGFEMNLLRFKPVIDNTIR